MLKPRLVSAASATVPTITPERQELAKAIEELRQRSAEMAAVEKAIATASERVFSLAAAVDTATEDVDKAKADTVTHLVDHAMGGTAVAPRTIRQARNALQEAEDELAAARTARGELERRKADLLFPVSLATGRVDDAITAVLQAAPETAAAVAELAELVRRLATLGPLVTWLSAARVFAADAPETLLAKRLPDALDGVFFRESSVAPPDPRRDPAIDARPAWQAAVAALRSDAAAPLPAVR